MGAAGAGEGRRGCQGAGWPVLLEREELPPRVGNLISVSVTCLVIFFSRICKDSACLQDREDVLHEAVVMIYITFSTWLQFSKSRH